MPLNTVTLVLSGDGGDIPFSAFAEAVRNFYALVSALSEETGGQGIEWVVDDLSWGSTVATARGIGDLEAVERVVRSYGEVGVSLQEERPVPHAPKVKAAAGRLRAIVGGRVESIRMETAEREAIVRPKRPKKPEPAVIPATVTPVRPSPPLRSMIRPAASAFGAVQGRVQTLTNRGGLRFTIYDALDDKAISCYLTEGREDVMRGAWGKLATVEGWVTRDPITGRPLTVRQIEGITVHQESPGKWRTAAGAVPWSAEDPLPEELIRRMRDA